NAALTDQGWKAGLHSATAGASQATIQTFAVDGAVNTINTLKGPSEIAPPVPTPVPTGGDGEAVSGRDDSTVPGGASGSDNGGAPGGGRDGSRRGDDTPGFDGAPGPDRPEAPDSAATPDTDETDLPDLSVKPPQAPDADLAPPNAQPGSPAPAGGPSPTADTGTDTRGGRDTTGETGDVPALSDVPDLMADDASVTDDDASLYDPYDGAPVPDNGQGMTGKPPVAPDFSVLNGQGADGLGPMNGAPEDGILDITAEVSDTSGLPGPNGMPPVAPVAFGPEAAAQGGPSGPSSGQPQGNSANNPSNSNSNSNKPSTPQAPASGPLPGDSPAAGRDLGDALNGSPQPVDTQSENGQEDRAAEPAAPEPGDEFAPAPPQPTAADAPPTQSEHTADAGAPGRGDGFTPAEQPPRDTAADSPATQSDETADDYDLSLYDYDDSAFTGPDTRGPIPEPPFAGKPEGLDLSSLYPKAPDHPDFSALNLKDFGSTQDPIARFLADLGAPRSWETTPLPVSLDSPLTVFSAWGNFTNPDDFDFNQIGGVPGFYGTSQAATAPQENPPATAPETQ
ncbi:hypothetical protein ACFONH_27420, partial [Streptomonospora nanhaiensis]